MKFIVTKILWCDIVEPKWETTRLADDTLIEMGKVEENHLGVSAFVEIKLEPSGETRYHTVEWITSEALFQGIQMINDYSKQKEWRRDFGQI